MDDPRVERYLAEVSARLRSLSPVQRDEEMRELRQHLDALIDVERGRGVGEGEAVDAALRRFGDAGDVGRRLQGAWARRRPPRLWPFVVIYAALAVLLYAGFATANDKPTDFPHGVVDQLVMALVLPSGVLVIRLVAYVRARMSGARA